MAKLFRVLCWSLCIVAVFTFYVNGRSRVMLRLATMQVDANFPPDPSRLDISGITAPSEDDILFEDANDPPENRLESKSYAAAIASASPSSASSYRQVADIGNQLEKMNKLLFDSNTRDEMFSQRVTQLHHNILLNLVQSNVQNRATSDVLQAIPSSYVTAIEWIDDIIATLRAQKDKAAATVRLLQKKEGISKLHRSGQSLCPNLTSRDVLEVKRKTERCLSEVLTFLIALTQARASDDVVVAAAQEADLLYFTKALVEKTQAHDRHFALLFLCRSILGRAYNAGSGGHNDLRGIVTSNGTPRHGAKQQPALSMKHAFQQGMLLQGINQPSMSSRLAFPFLSAVYRAYYYVVGLDQGDGPLPNSDGTVCHFLKTLMEIDRRAELSKTLAGAADDMVVALQRWICDMAAMYFINLNPQLLSQASGLPESIRRNTVTMELVCTARSMREGKKKAREGLLLCSATLGRYLDLIMYGSFEDGESAGWGQEGLEGLEGQVGPDTSLPQPVELTASPLLLNARRLMATVSTLTPLPETHSIKRRASWLLGLQHVGVQALRRSQLSRQKRLRDADGSDTEDSLFGSPKGRGGGGDIGFAKADWRGRKNGQGEKDKFDPLSDMDEEHGGGRLGARRGYGEHLPDNKAALEGLPDMLLELLATTLRVPSARVLGSADVRAEVLSVFTIWRRPQLLLDYHRMHASSPELQETHTRFLKSLFAMSNETVDCIRYKDPGNRAHLDRLPHAVAQAWESGFVYSGGTVQRLPGFADAQTLFMLGEDSGTCMSVRSRQKGTNRGLLSLCLHGNVRVLGSKDSTGRLLARALVRLLIDEATGQPVLFVDAIYGADDTGDAGFGVGAGLVCDQAAELGQLLGVAVVYASPPSRDEYTFGPIEVPAVTADWRRAVTASASSLQPVLHEAESPSGILGLCNISDYTNFSSHVWMDGITNPRFGKQDAPPDDTRFIPGYHPLLFRRDRSAPSVTYGLRPVGVLEQLVEKGVLSKHELPQARTQHEPDTDVGNSLAGGTWKTVTVSGTKILPGIEGSVPRSELDVPILVGGGARGPSPQSPMPPTSGDDDRLSDNNDDDDDDLFSISETDAPAWLQPAVSARDMERRENWQRQGGGRVGSTGSGKRDRDADTADAADTSRTQPNSLQAMAAGRRAKLMAASVRARKERELMTLDNTMAKGEASTKATEGEATEQESDARQKAIDALLARGRAARERALEPAGNDNDHVVSVGVETETETETSMTGMTDERDQAVDLSREVRIDEDVGAGVVESEVGATLVTEEGDDDFFA